MKSVIFLVSLRSSCGHVLSLQKMFLFYDNNVNQLPYLTRDHKWFYRSALLRLILMQKEGEIKK